MHMKFFNSTEKIYKSKKIPLGLTGLPCNFLFVELC